MIKQIEGGVCAAKGFTASGVHCGIRKNRTKKDLSLIFSQVPAAAAAVYTLLQDTYTTNRPLAVRCREICYNILLFCPQGQR